MNLSLGLLSVALSLTVVASSPLRERDDAGDYFANRRYVVMPDDNGKLHLVDLQAPIARMATLQDITLYLHGKNFDVPDVVDATDYRNILTSTKFDPTLKTVFLVHGWNNDYLSPFNTLTTGAILENFNVNVFVVDWGKPANDINYVTARASALFVGNFLGDFINYVTDAYDYPPSNVYMIGHSLGAHACGAAGSRTDGQVHVIIGLDAARPLFPPGQPETRLDPEDARFVHVVHTNTAFLGYKEPLGHADYYPNGGAKQPGCGLDLVGICSHGRAYEFFAESIRASRFLALRCDSYEDYEGGLCGDRDESVLGQLEVDRTAAGVYYLRTNEQSPYAQG